MTVFYTHFFLAKETGCMEYGTAQLMFVDCYYLGLAIKTWGRNHTGSLIQGSGFLLCLLPQISHIECFWCCHMISHSRLNAPWDLTSGERNRSKTLNWSQNIPKGSKKEVWSFYCLFYFKSWISGLVEFIEGWFYSYGQCYKQATIPQDLIRPFGTALTSQTSCPHLGSF